MLNPTRFSNLCLVEYVRDTNDNRIQNVPPDLSILESVYATHFAVIVVVLVLVEDFTGLRIIGLPSGTEVLTRFHFPALYIYPTPRIDTTEPRVGCSYEHNSVKGPLRP